MVVKIGPTSFSEDHSNRFLLPRATLLHIHHVAIVLERTPFSRAPQVTGHLLRALTTEMTLA